MADLRDFTGKNRKFTGIIGEKISTGTTGERDTSFGGGTIRFNSTTNLMEYYTGTEWKSIDAPPSITSFTVNGGSPTVSAFLPGTSSISTIVITGSLFDTTGATVLFVGNGGGDVSPLTTVRNSSSQITVTVNTSNFNGTYEPYDLKVTNGSGLFALLENCIVSDTAPIFTTASGTLGTIADTVRSSYSLSTAAATDPDGDTITYSITSGALPTGLSLNASTAAITGTASAVVTNTTSTFTVSAATTNQTSTRSFSITVNAPVVETFTSVGAFTFNVPVGVSSVQVLTIAGGGGGGSVIGGGGGAGGMVEISSYPVTPGGTVTGNVGGGGAGRPPDRRANGGTGTNSVFGNITAVGGGGGASWSSGGPGGQGHGQPGGSGGGGSHGATGPDGRGGTGTQGPSGGGTGYGFPGYRDEPASSAGGAGGGAGSGGPTNTARRTGGDGRVSNITGSPVTYAGGGGCGNHGGTANTTGGTGGGGHGFPGGGNAATANRGSGGGGGYYPPDQTAGSGGSGIVIVKY